MFNILIIWGTVLIILGVFFKYKYSKINNSIRENIVVDEAYNYNNLNDLRKNINRSNHGTNNIDENNEVEGLEVRLEQLEKMLFKQLLEKETSKPIFAEDLEEDETEIEKNALDKYELIRKYKGQGKSLDEMAALLGINKGEVILLKNLYKNS